jgi:hypothetical protein
MLRIMDQRARLLGLYKNEGIRLEVSASGKVEDEAMIKVAFVEGTRPNRRSLAHSVRLSRKPRGAPHLVLRAS